MCHVQLQTRGKKNVGKRAMSNSRSKIFFSDLTLNALGLLISEKIFFSKTKL